MPFWGIPIYSRKNLNIVNIVIFTLFFWFSFNQFHSSNIFEHDFPSWCRFVHSKDRFQRKLTAAPLRSQIASLAKDASWIHIYIYISTVWNGILMTFACFWAFSLAFSAVFFFRIFWKVVVPFSRVLACNILWYLFTWGQIHPRFLATPTAQMQAKQCSGAGAERWNGSTDQRFSYFCSSVFNTSHISSVCFAFPFSKPLLGSAKEDVVITQMSLIAAMLDPEASQLLSSRSWTLQSSCAFSAFIRFNWLLLAAGKLHFPGESLRKFCERLRPTQPGSQNSQTLCI